MNLNEDVLYEKILETLEQDKNVSDFLRKQDILKLINEYCNSKKEFLIEDSYQEGYDDGYKDGFSDAEEQLQG